MRIRNLVGATVLAAFLALVVAAPQPAFAWGGCSGTSYYVQRGDTLFSIGMRYGMTVTTLRQANPNLGYWLYAGQTICIPDGYGRGYDGYQQGYDGHGYDGYQQGYDGCGYGGCGYDGHQHGYDGCGYGGCGYDGPQQGYDGCSGYGCDGYGNDYQGNWSDKGDCGYGCDGSGYHGQWTDYNNGYGYDGGAFYTVQRGDTLAKIAARCGTTWYKLLAMNPQIWNPNWIYAGQVIRVR